MRNEEHRIQVALVKHARARWPICRTNLFAIPNGGARNVVTGKLLKAEGVLSGVADLFLALPISKTSAGKNHVSISVRHGLWIEVKTKTGRISEAQGKFRDSVVEAGYTYRIVSSTEEGLEVIKKYLEETG